MGHFIYEDELDRIELEDGEWIDIKRQMSVGDYDRIAKESEEGEIEGRVIITLLANIKAWSLKGKDSQIAPINREMVAKLDADTAILLFNEIGKRNPAQKKSLDFDEQIWVFLDRGEGKVPKSYINYMVMKEMGWSWQELQACPQNTYLDIIRYLNTEAKFQKARSK